MDPEASLRTLLSTVNFGIRKINAIIEFWFDNLINIAVVSIKDLDNDISNLHKTMSGLPPNRRICLNVSKYILLHTISLHFYDYSLCASPLQAADIVALVSDNNIAMKIDYAV